MPGKRKKGTKLSREQAASQMTGYDLAKNGGDIVDLALTMGLTKSEWKEIKREYDWIWSKDFRAELDAAFDDPNSELNK